MAIVRRNGRSALLASVLLLHWLIGAHSQESWPSFEAEAAADILISEVRVRKGVEETSDAIRLRMDEVFNEELPVIPPTDEYSAKAEEAIEYINALQQNEVDSANTLTASAASSLDPEAFSGSEDIVMHSSTPSAEPLPVVVVEAESLTKNIDELTKEPQVQAKEFDSFVDKRKVSEPVDQHRGTSSTEPDPVPSLSVSASTGGILDAILDDHTESKSVAYNDNPTAISSEESEISYPSHPNDTEVSDNHILPSPDSIAAMQNNLPATVDASVESISSIVENSSNITRKTDSPDSSSASTAYQKPYCGIWGTCRRKHTYNVSLLFQFFQYNILGNKTEYLFSDPHVEAIKITNAAFKMANAEESSVLLSTKPTNEFVDGLDDFDKFFEGVDPPDELDVGAGSSIREVLMGQGTRIIIKRLKMGVAPVLKAFVASRNKVLRRLQDDTGNLSLMNEAKFGAARQWLVVTTRKLFRATRRVVDNVMEGNFEGILDAFDSGNDDDDLSYGYDFDPLPIKEFKSPTENTAHAAKPYSADSQRSPTSKIKESIPRQQSDADMDELIRLMGLSPDSSPTSTRETKAPISTDKPLTSSKAPSIDSSSANGASRKPSMEKEREELLRQLGL
jgi:hypothetical protein